MPEPSMSRPRELRTNILAVGGGLGGVAASLAAVESGTSVILTEKTAWLGGQMTIQGTPPDEHPWIESFGSTASYRAFRTAIRDYYRTWFPLERALRRKRYLNPGAGSVSSLCHEPRVSLAVMEGLLAPYRSSGLLRVLTGVQPRRVDVDGDRVRAVILDGPDAPHEVSISATYVLDATETGELLPLTGTEYVTGAE